MTQNYNYKWDSNKQDIKISHNLLTRHSINAINGRLSDLVTIQDVKDSVIKHHDTIIKHKSQRQVMIIIKAFKHVINRGTSNGKLIVACIDPKTITVKTVMLRHSRQMGKKVT